MSERDEERLKIWYRLTPEQRDYDRFVARRIPRGANMLAETRGGAQLAMGRTDDLESGGCSCHILPPCSHCVGDSEDDDVA